MTDDPIITEQTDLMQYVPKVHFEQIPIKNLVSNQEYQRNLSQHHVQRAAANFDLYQINPVKVAVCRAPIGTVVSIHIARHDALHKKCRISFAFIL